MSARPPSRSSASRSGTARSRPSAASTSGSSPGRPSASSARTAPASPRRSRSSAPSPRRPPASARVAGYDVRHRARRGPPQHRPGLPGADARPLPHRRAEPALPRRALRRARAAASSRRIDEVLEMVGLCRPARRPGRDVLRRHEAPARDRPRPAALAAGAVPRRADDRARPADPRVDLGATSTSCGEREDITVFVTTHYMDEAEHCDRIAIMDHGEIVVDRHARGAEVQHRQRPGAVRTDDDELARSPRSASGSGSRPAMHEGQVTFARRRTGRSSSRGCSPSSACRSGR